MSATQAPYSQLGATLQEGNAALNGKTCQPDNQPQQASQQDQHYRKAAADCLGELCRRTEQVPGPMCAGDQASAETMLIG